MVEQIHLQNRLVYRHGLIGEGLAADLEFLLVLLKAFVDVVHVYEGVTAKPLFQTGLVLSDLTLDGINGAVKGILKGIVLHLASEHGVRRRDGHFKIFLVALVAEGDDGLAFLLKILVQLLELFENHSLGTLADVHLPCVDGNFHSGSSLKLLQAGEAR